MGTGNFSNENANSVFAVLMDKESDYDFFVEDIIEVLEDKGFTEINRRDNARNYSGLELAAKAVSKQYCGVWFEVNITAILRTGYYQGANLDWSIAYCIGDSGWFDSLPDLNSIKDDLSYYGAGMGIATIQSKNALKWLENAPDGLIEELEAIYRDVCEHELAEAARFSNGEVMYCRK
jgi:hypothetical protein